jgi:RND family efflux transporter MFP subunit
MMPIDMNSDKTTPSDNYSREGHLHGDLKEVPENDPAPKQASAGVWIVVVIGLLLVIGAVVYGLLERAAAEKRLRQVTKTDSIQSVNVVHPSTTEVASEIALPGNTEAYDDTPIYARTSGYLKQWFVDIGQHVSKGQLMATIETPELDQQLQVARADLKSAEADLMLAKSTSERYQNLLKSDSVSKQETEVAVSGAAAKQAAVDAAQANVRRLAQLQSFEKVYAPYSGVVTERNTDIGDLIDAGSPTTSGTAKELFRIASINKLRVFVAVPEMYAAAIHDGDTATLTFDEYPGQKFSGKIARNSNAIDPASRTLNVEVDVNNASGKLLPGAYAFVHFKIPQQIQMLSIPANTLLFRAQGLQVALVRDGRIHLQNITIGKDNGSSLEVASGLSANDEVVLDPTDSVAEDEQVKVSGQGTVTQ